MRAAIVVAALALAGCGGGDDELTVFAAASLQDVLPALEPDARYNFAGSDELATQIREGADADVLVSASFRLALELYRDRLASRPLVVATNRLVLVVSRSTGVPVRSYRDLANRDVKVVLGDVSVPAGAYAAEMLRRGGVRPNVVSYENDVRGVLAKVALGEADAGIVYTTDVAGTDNVRVFQIDRRLQPRIVYAATVVHEGDRDEARAFVDRLRSPAGRAALVEAGFGPP